MVDSLLDDVLTGDFTDEEKAQAARQLPYLRQLARQHVARKYGFTTDGTTAKEGQSSATSLSAIKQQEGIMEDQEDIEVGRLTLTRRVGEVVKIGPNVFVKVVEARPGQVRLVFTAPTSVEINRLEIAD
jgi:carbon storage regulator CsrA